MTTPFPAVPGEAVPGNLSPGDPGSTYVPGPAIGPFLAGAKSTNGTSMSIPVGISVQANGTIQVGVVGAGSTFTVGPDTAGNSYSLVLSNATETGLYIFESDGINPVDAGVDSIPVTQNVSGLLEAIAVGANGVSGLDKSVIAAGSSTAPSSGSTGTLSQAAEYAIAWMTDMGTGGVSLSWASPWSSNVLQTFAGEQLSAAATVVSATTALTASGTLTVSEGWVCACTTLLVTPLTVSLTPSNGVVGVPYSQTLENLGGASPFTWSVVSGTLPPGLTLTSGVISGTPLGNGVYHFTLQVEDATSTTATLAVAVEILSGATGAAAFTQVANNLLPPDDSDFETGTTGWVADFNAAVPFVTSEIAFTGSECCGWSTQVDGASSITTGTRFATAPGLPYILSGFLLSAEAGYASLGVAWYTSTGVYLSTSSGPTVPTANAQWTPMQATFTAPAGAGLAAPVVTVAQGNAGDVNYIDTMWFSQTDTQVLVDWVNAPFQPGGNAGSAFMDVSPWVRMDGTGVTYTTGRQDAISEIQGASGSFTLQGDQGQWTPNNSAAHPIVSGGQIILQRRVQFNFADDSGIWHTRFDGAISEIDPVFDNTGNTAQLTVMVTDVLSFLQRQDPLLCWTVEQVLNDEPMYTWRLDDAGTFGGAGVAAETSGNNGPGLRLLNSDSTMPGGTGAAAVTWEDTSGGVETLADAASATGQDGSAFWTTGSNQPTNPVRGLVSGNVGPFTTPIGSVLLTPYNLSTSNPWPTGTQTAQNTFVGTTGYMLTTQLPSPLTPTSTGTGYSFEIWAMPDPSIAANPNAKYGPFIALALGSSSTKTNLLAGIFLNSGNPTFECATYSQPPAFLGLNWPGTAVPTATASTSVAFTPDKVKRPHHVVVTITGDPTAATVNLWLDGSEVGSFALPKGQTYDTVCVGGAYGGTGAWYGNLSIASIYGYVLSPQQIVQHCQMGQYGMWENTSDDCIAQLGTIAGLPSFWSGLGAGHAGLTMTEYLDITNSNAISAMQQYEDAEGGLLYVNATGGLTFHTRAWRMGARGPSLFLPPDTFDANMQWRMLDQFQCNEEGVSGPNTLGATATTLLANTNGTSVGSTTTQVSTSSVIQAGYVNGPSQDEYGVYASYPVSSPLALPLITWSRGYAAVGLPSYSFWIDPNLIDRASWDATSRSDPWFVPTSVTIDLLTLDPNAGLTIADVYAVGIDSMIAPTPDTLPPNFPNVQGSLEWWIEGYQETRTATSHTISFYTSPAEAQRAWIPGDTTYGIPGSTTRLGISAADLSQVQADGKTVSHDAGAPYWAPDFTATMNAPNGETLGFVGAGDMRGILNNLAAMLRPTMCVVTATTETQSFTNGALTGTSPPNIATLYWDVIHVDTAGGMGAVPGWPNWYLCNDPGFYEIDGNVTWSVTGSGLGGYCGQAWIVVAQDAAQAIAAGTGNPLTVNQYVCPVGDASRFNAASATPVNAPTTVMYLGLGDMVCIAAEHNYTSSRGTSTAGAGSAMSIRKLGNSRVDDRTLINTSLGSGGTVSLKSHGTLQQAVFNNTHTYSYQGKTGLVPDGRRNTDLDCYQGLIGSGSEGSQVAQIAFNATSIASTLTGHTVLSATLTGSNISSYYSTGAKAMVGSTGVTPGGTTFNAPGSWTTVDVMHQLFQSGATDFTFNIPVSLVQGFVTGSQLALVLGDGQTTDLEYAGSWVGGPDSWTLTVNYV